MSHCWIRFHHSAAALSRRIGDDIVVTNVDRDDFELLTGPATRVWQLLSIPRAFPDLLVRLADHYGVPTLAVASDVEALLDHLLRGGFVEEVVEADG